MKYNGIKVKTGQHRIQLEASEADGGERNCTGGEEERRFFEKRGGWSRLVLGTESR